MAAKFGTSGLRGLVEDITDGTCERYVCGFLHHLLDEGLANEGDKVFIGQDFRPSSPMIADQTARAAHKHGFVPIDCGTVPTPALALYAMNENCASIMITGSHIPADRNGIKFYRKDGEINKADETRISKFAQEIDVHDAAEMNFEKAEDQSKAVSDLFIKRYRDVFSSDLLSGKRIGVYEHSSVARDILKTLLADLGATVVPLGRSETFIPVDTEAVSDETIENLSKWTKDHRLDAIVSTDGDADRPLLSGEDGRYIKGDILGHIASSYLKADMVATPVSSNSAIKSNALADVVNTRVGSPYVIEAMNEASMRGKTRIVGFEANGGFLTASGFSVGNGRLAPLPTRDCVLPVIAVLASAVKAQTTLVDLVAGQKLPITHSGRIQNFATDKSQTLIQSLKGSESQCAAFFKPFGSVKDVNLVDGLRVTLDNGQIIHLRPSGNAPEMRCYVEARTMDGAQILVQQVIDHILKMAP